MDWSKLENIASGKNLNGSEMFHKDNLSRIISKIVIGRKNIVDILSSLGSILIWNKLFTPEYLINKEYLAKNPEIAEAIELSASSVDIETLEFDTQKQVMGFVNLTKGKLFELKVAEKLNNGERVGDFELESGQTVQLAESPIQEGHDLEIINADGTIEEFYQCKATDSISLIKNALKESPDIQVIATSEVSESLSDADVLDSGISNESLQFSLSNLLDPDLLNDIPGAGEAFALLAIGKEAFGVYKGNNTIKTGIKNSVNYLLGRTVATIGGGVAATSAIAIGCGPLAIAAIGISGAVLTGRIYRKNKDDLIKYFKRKWSIFNNMFDDFFESRNVFNYREIMIKRYGLNNIQKKLKDRKYLDELIKPFGFKNIFTKVAKTTAIVATAALVGKAAMMVLGSVLGGSLFS